jgi:hypothetical protein
VWFRPSHHNERSTQNWSFWLPVKPLLTTAVPLAEIANAKDGNSAH